MGNQVGEEQKNNEVKPKPRPFRIGIIVNGYNDEDILYYNEQFKEINRKYKDKVRLVFIGYKPEADRLGMLKGVIFEYVKPVSIVHYFKQLNFMKIDLLFIPLINNKFNATSENYNKYLEAGIFKIPVIAPDIYPYHKIIKSGKNGFIYGNREQFIPYLQDLLMTKLKTIKPCGEEAYNLVVNEFNYSEKNIHALSQHFQQMEKCNMPYNSKYIGYQCVMCSKKIDEDERQKIISLGCVQTWCLLCIAIKYPSDNSLHRYVQTHGKDDTIIYRNKMMNNE